MTKYEDFSQVMDTLRGDEPVSKIINDLWWEVYKLKLRVKELEHDDDNSHT